MIVTKGTALTSLHLKPTDDIYLAVALSLLIGREGHAAVYRNDLRTVQWDSKDVALTALVESLIHQHEKRLR